MDKAGLLSLGGSLCLVQRAAGGAVRSPFRFQRGFQLSDARLEHCRGIVIAPAVEDDHRYAAILHETVAGTHLVGTLLWRLPGWPLQAQGTTHSVFSGLRVTW